MQFKGKQALTLDLKVKSTYDHLQVQNLVLSPHILYSTIIQSTHPKSQRLVVTY